MNVLRISLLAAVLAAGALTGCKHSYEQQTQDLTPSWEPMRASTRVFIAMPEDALDKKEPVPASGKRTALALHDAFSRHTKAVFTARSPEPFAESLARARAANCEYMIFPTIILWQDRPTEWTGVRDKLQVKIDLVSVQSGVVVRTTTIDGKSRFMTDGGDAPQDLLSEPIDRFVRPLFRLTHTPTALTR